MPGPAPQPASPPTFYLRIRLTDLSGSSEPFLGRDYEIEWGGERVVWDRTVPPDGVVVAALAGAPREGMLTLGEKTGDGGFVPHLKIPLKAVPVPPTPAPAESLDDLPSIFLQTAMDLGRRRDAFHHRWAWRLSNLGHFPGLWQLEWPVAGNSLTRLADAVRRYAHKNPLPANTSSWDILAPMVQLDAVLRKEHDGT